MAEYMTPAEYRSALEEYGISAHAARLIIRVSPRTAYRYACGSTKIPSAVADLLRLLAAGTITERQIETLRPLRPRHVNGKKRGR